MRFLDLFAGIGGFRLGWNKRATFLISALNVFHIRMGDAWEDVK